jgi:hypothetical protein
MTKQTGAPRSGRAVLFPSIKAPPARSRNFPAASIGYTRKVRESAGRSLSHGAQAQGKRKVRAPQDTVVGNSHRPRRPPRVAKDRESATESIPPEAPAPGKGEKVGELRLLNVRAHQQPGDRLARQTPPGARPNKGAGLVRPIIDSRVGRSSAGATRRLDK